MEEQINVAIAVALEEYCIKEGDVKGHKIDKDFYSQTLYEIPNLPSPRSKVYTGKPFVISTKGALRFMEDKGNSKVMVTFDYYLNNTELVYDPENNIFKVLKIGTLIPVKRR